MPMTMDERLDHARSAITAYFSAKGEPERTCDAEYEDTDVSDLIADLLHLQNFLGSRDIDKTLATAQMHYEAEQEEHKQRRKRRMTQYEIGSSHGELTADRSGYVIHCRTDNNDDGGGGHLASIVRFNIKEWRRHSSCPQERHIDILDVGYWYIDHAAKKTVYVPPDEKWRKEIAEILLKRSGAVQPAGDAV